LIGVDDLWLMASSKTLLQILQTGFRDKSVQELPAEHAPVEKMYDRQQVKEAFIQRDLCDSGGPDLIHSSDRADFIRQGECSDFSSRRMV
jgi:hypothetical protein